MFWSVVHVYSELLGQCVFCVPQKQKQKNYNAGVRKRDHFSQRLIASSCLEEVWLMFYAEAHCKLGKPHPKWGHVMWVSILTQFVLPQRNLFFSSSVFQIRYCSAVWRLIFLDLSLDGDSFEVTLFSPYLTGNVHHFYLSLLKKTN